MCVPTIRTLPAYLVAVALTVAPTCAHASPSAGSRASSSPAPRSAFERNRDLANEAAEGGDWDTVLRAAEDGLAALPESDDTHTQRAVLIDLVGDFRLDNRTRPQLQASASILRAYIDDLRTIYGTAAERRNAWVDANAYLDDIERRLAVVPPPTTDTPAEAPRPAPTDLQRDMGSSSAIAMQAAGAVSLGLGAALTIVGFVYASRWSSEASAYNQLEGRNATNPGSVSPSEEQSQYAELGRARATSLGAGIPGLALMGVGVALVVIGTRRAGGKGRVSSTAGSVRVRF